MIDDKKIGQVLVRPASVVANVLDLKNKHLSENEQWHCNNCGVEFMLQAEFCIILLAVWGKPLYCLHSLFEGGRDTLWVRGLFRG